MVHLPHTSSLLTIFYLLLLSPAQAQLLHYWNFADKTKVDQVGSGVLQTSWSGVGISLEGYGTSTEVNRQDPFPQGHSLSYFDPAIVFSNHNLTFSHLDLSGHDQVVLSFAIRSNAILGIGEHLEVSYNTGSGWYSAGELTPASSAWTSRAIDFGDLFYNDSQVALRISHHALFEASEFLDFANIALVAVPEPSYFALPLGLLIGVVLLRKYTRSSLLS